MENQRAVKERDRSHEDVVLVRLSEENKQRLLGPATKLVVNQPNAKKVFQRLTNFNSAFATNFAWKESAVSEAPFKLLFSRKAEVVQDLSRPVGSYIIISYCWHDSDSDWEKAGSGDVQEPWPIQRPFVEDVMKLRSSENEGVWIDQLSIDQGNYEEKMQAIASMDIIYQCARQLVIVLEDITIPAKEEEIINRYWEKLTDHWDDFSGWLGWLRVHGPGEDIRLLGAAYTTILSARWFKRAWCIHEFRVSQYTFDDPGRQPRFRAMGMAGNVVKIPAVLLFFMSNIVQQSPHTEDVKKLHWLMARSKIQTLHTSKGPKISGSWSLIQQVHDTCNLDCSKINDKVQIAINLSGLPLCWKGSAESDNDVYWVFILLALAANEASVLAFNGPPILFRHPNGEILPSWARRSYSTQGECRILVERDELGISSFSPEYVDIDLLFLQKQAQRPSEEALLLADKIIRQNQLCDRKVSVLDPLKQRDVDSLLSEYDNKTMIHAAVRDTVACFIDGGIPWMKSAWDVLYTELVREGRQDKDDTFYAGFFGTFDESASHLRSAAETILDLSNINENRMDFNTLYLQPVLNLLALVTDGRFRRFLQHDTMRIQTSSTGDQALVRGVLPVQEMAVPAALATQDSVVSRCWILEPGDETTTGSWKIVGKCFLLGCGTLEADGDIVTRKERQRVRGGDLSYKDRLDLSAK